MKEFWTLGWKGRENNLQKLRRKRKEIWLTTTTTKTKSDICASCPISLLFLLSANLGFRFAIQFPLFSLLVFASGSKLLSLSLCNFLFLYNLARFWCLHVSIGALSACFSSSFSILNDAGVNKRTESLFGAWHCFCFWSFDQNAGLICWIYCDLLARICICCDSYRYLQVVCQLRV